jgi:hypothetical protein
MSVALECLSSLMRSVKFQIRFLGRPRSKYGAGGGSSCCGFDSFDRHKSRVENCLTISDRTKSYVRLALRLGSQRGLQAHEVLFMIFAVINLNLNCCERLFHCRMARIGVNISNTILSRALRPLLIRSIAPESAFESNSDDKFADPSLRSRKKRLINHDSFRNCIAT